MIFSARKWRVDLDQCDALLASSRRRAAAGSGAGTGLICCDGVVADYAEDAHVVQAALRICNVPITARTDRQSMPVRWVRQPVTAYRSSTTILDLHCKDYIRQ